MSDQSKTSTEAPAKAKRKPQGPRKPSPIYAFASVADGNGSPVAGAKVVIHAQFRDPRKMAEYFQGEGKALELLIIAPEA